MTASRLSCEVSRKDTVRDLDDMPNPLPGRPQVSLITQADFIPLHETHICNRIHSGSYYATKFQFGLLYTHQIVMHKHLQNPSNIQP